LRGITEKIVKSASGPLRANRPGGDKAKKVWRHECDDFDDAKTCQLCRIFGATGEGDKDNYPGALLVRDSTLFNKDKLLQDGLPITETKMENAIDRLTSAASPRTFERVPAGAEFEFELVYRVETLEPEGVPKNGNVTVDSARVKTDITNLLAAMDILEKDGLGGNISRGYGRIEFKVKEFQGYDINNEEKGGFKTDDSQSLNSCKGKLNDTVFM
jgi:CRISPR-associated protein Csm3